MSYKLQGVTFAGAILTCFALFISACSSPKSDFFGGQNGYFEAGGDSENSLAIIVPQNPTKSELRSAKILARHLSKIGVKTLDPRELPADLNSCKRIYLRRRDKLGERALSPLAQFKSASEIRLNISSDAVELEYGKNPQAAVGFLLEKLGFEFLAPGELGLVEPNARGVKLKCGQYLKSPKFLSGDIYLGRLLKYPDEAEDFLALSGMTPTFTHFSHNLSRIFDAEVLAKYPQFKPQLRKFTAGDFYQPDISNPLAPIIAAEKAAEAFEKNLDLASFSIGINDSVNYDLRVSPNPPPDAFAYGYQNYSDSYFKFANQSAALLSEKFPDKFLGGLAYLTTESAPNFKVKPNMGVYAATDHANYFNEEFKLADFEKLRNWSKSGAGVLGVYSYIYGAAYRIPRNIEKYEFEAMREAYRQGFKFYFAESAPVWAYDNFKIWLVLRILNGDERSYAKLRAHYFESYYAESAKYAEEFFNISEWAWADRSDAPRWLGLYKQSAQAELFPKELLNQMEAALQKAEKSAKSTTVKDRLFELRLEFEQTKKFCADYFAKKAIFKGALKESSPDILKLIEVSKVAESESNLCANIRNALTKFPSAKLANIDNFIPPIDTLVLKNLPALSESEKISLKKNLGESDFANILAASQNKKECVFETEFEFPEFAALNPCIGTFPSYFRSMVFPDKDCSFCIVKTPQNKFKVRIANANPFELSKTEKVDEGALYIFRARVNFKLSISARVYLNLVFADERGRILKRKTSGFAPLNRAESSEFKIVCRAPKGSKLAGFGISGMSLRADDFAELESLKLEEVLEN